MPSIWRHDYQLEIRSKQDEGEAAGEGQEPRGGKGGRASVLMLRSWAPWERWWRCPGRWHEGTAERCQGEVRS